MTQRIQRIQCGNGNAYIVARGEDAVLIDTGRGRYRDKILAACRPYRMRLLILTHGHIDHVENAAYLSEALGIPVAMGKEDIPLLADNLAQPLEAKTIPGKVVLAASIKLLRDGVIAPFTPAVTLAEGDRLDEYGVSAKIIAVPGHTRGSIAVEVEETALMVGDALMNLFYPTVSMLYHDREEMLRSAEKIRELGERTIYFGHGGPRSNSNWK